MEVLFKDADLDRLEIDAAFDGSYPPAVVSGFRKCMQLIRCAVDERDFYSLRSRRFEKLSGSRKHQYSMRINDQWRLILELDGRGRDKTVIIVGIEDYH